jgi:hypothetical protein
MFRKALMNRCGRGGPVALHGGAFKFVGTANVSKFTTVTENNALLAQSSHKTAVSVNGAFTAHGRFSLTAQLGQSPCGGTAYTAIRKPGPAPG